MNLSTKQIVLCLLLSFQSNEVLALHKHKHLIKEEKSNTGSSSPLTGNFFYTTMYEAESKGDYFIKFLMGSQDQEINAKVSLDGTALEVVSTNCSDSICKVEQKFNVSSSATAIDQNEMINEDMRYIDKRFVNKLTFQGRKFIDDVDFIHSDYQTKFNLPITMIDSSMVSYKSSYSSQLGLNTPYSFKDQRQSFLQNAKNSGKIDHLVFSVYNNLNETGKSSIKFGSYDKSGLASGSHLTYIKTKSPASWDIQASSMNIGNQQIPFDNSKKIVQLEPSVPYMQIPQKDFETFLTIARSRYLSLGIICTSQECYFDSDCEDTQNKLKDRKYNKEHGQQQLGIKLNYQNSDGTSVNYPINVNLEKIMVSGNQIGQSDQRCYLTVFPHNKGQSNTWYVGSLFLQDYYLVFDMTPYDELKKDFIQIGIGKINLKQLSLQVHPHKIINQAPIQSQKQVPSDNNQQNIVPIFLVSVAVFIAVAFSGVAVYFYKKRKERTRSQQSSSQQTPSDEEQASQKDKQETLLGSATQLDGEVDSDVSPTYVGIQHD